MGGREAAFGTVPAWPFGGGAPPIAPGAPPAMPLFPSHPAVGGFPGFGSGAEAGAALQWGAPPPGAVPFQRRRRPRVVVERADWREARG